MKLLWILALSFLPAVVPHQVIVLNPCLCFNNGMCYGSISENGCRTYFNSSTCVSAAVEQRCPDGEAFDVLSCGCASSDTAVCSSECRRPHGIVPILSTTTTTPTPTTTSPTPTTTARPECPDGWVENPYNKCYKFVTGQKLNWEDANETCQAMDSLLATPGFSEEIKWIRDYRANHSDLQDRMWLGGVKRYGYWNWVAGVNEVQIRITDWSSGEPSKRRGENCLQLFEGRAHRIDYITDSFSRWNDVSCSETMNFICQQGAASTLTTTRRITTTTTTPTPTIAYNRKCSEGWIKSPSNRCYRFINNRKITWQVANTTCRGMDGFMAAPKTSSEIKWIRDYREDHSYLQDRMWLAGFKRSGSWYWDGAQDLPIEVTDWGNNEPSGRGENCLQLFEGNDYRTSKNRWGDVSCSEEMNFICERDSEYDPEATSPPPTPAGPRFCADGWVQSPTKCYKFVTAPEYGWNSAKYQCRSMSSYLATPRTIAELDWIRNFRESNSTLQGRTWIGGYKKEGLWTWADAIDSPLDWLDWAPGEPSFSWHGTYEGCMNLFEGSSLRSNPKLINRWNDAPCGDSMGYICQKEQEELSITTPQATDATTDSLSSHALIVTSTPTPTAVNLSITVTNVTAEAGLMSTTPSTTSMTSTPVASTSTMKPLPRCPYGWIRSSYDKCYKFVTEHKFNFEISNYRCNFMGGSIATPKTSSEIKWIRDYREAHPELQGRIRIGGFKRYAQWYWNDSHKTPFTTSDWAPGQPGPSWGCMELLEGSTRLNDSSRINRWTEVRCSVSTNFLCEKGLEEYPEVVEANSTAEKVCTEGWVESTSGLCYKFVNYPKYGWDFANQMCQAMDSMLATPNTSSETKWIRDYRSAHPEVQDRMWLGGRYQNHKWWWKGTNDTLIEAADWAPGEPSFPNWQRCLQLFEGNNIRLVQKNRWNDAQCGNEMGYVCQKPKN